MTKDIQIIKEILFKLNMVKDFKNKINELNTQKKELEDRYSKHFKKFHPKDEIDRNRYSLF